MNSKLWQRCFLIGFLINSTPILALELDKIELPDMGDSAGALISPAEEKQFGEAFFRSLHAQVTINQDSEIQHMNYATVTVNVINGGIQVKVKPQLAGTVVARTRSHGARCRRAPLLGQGRGDDAGDDPRRLPAPGRMAGCPAPG